MKPFFTLAKLRATVQSKLRKTKTIATNPDYDCRDFDLILWGEGILKFVDKSTQFGLERAVNRNLNADIKEAFARGQIFAASAQIYERDGSVFTTHRASLFIDKKNETFNTDINIMAHAACMEVRRALRRNNHAAATKVILLPVHTQGGPALIEIDAINHKGPMYELVFKVTVGVYEAPYGYVDWTAEDSKENKNETPTRQTP